MPEPKPSDFEEFKQLMLRQSSSDPRLAPVRALSFSILWALAMGIRGEILRDLIELLEFEIDLSKADK
jgi:hypothetical protein